MKKPIIIDGHAHACGSFLRTEGIVTLLDRNGVDKVVLVPGELDSDKDYNLINLAKWFPNSDVIAAVNQFTKIVLLLNGAAKHIPAGNRYVHSLVQEAPDRIIQFYWVQLHRPEFLEETKQYYHSWQFHGLKLHQVWESFHVRSEPFKQLINWADDRHLPIFIHMASKKETRHLIDVIRRHPNITFVIGHLFGLEEYILAEINSDNLFFDISTPPLISDRRLKKALDYYGPEKLTLGSDTPYGADSQRENIRRVNTLPISDDQKALVLGGNMARILKLGYVKSLRAL